MFASIRSRSMHRIGVSRSSFLAPMRDWGTGGPSIRSQESGVRSQKLVIFRCRVVATVHCPLSTDKLGDHDSSAADRDRLARHELCPLAEEKAGHFGDFLGSPEPPHR